MTTATLNNDGSDSRKGTDKAILPFEDNSVKWINGNSESPEIDARGFRGVGITLPSTAEFGGATALQIQVATKKGGVYAPLNIADIPLHATNKTTFATSFVAEWGSIKFVPVGAVTLTVDMPYCLS